MKNFQKIIKPNRSTTNMGLPTLCIKNQNIGIAETRDGALARLHFHKKINF